MTLVETKITSKVLHEDKVIFLTSPITIEIHSRPCETYYKSKYTVYYYKVPDLPEWLPFAAESNYATITQAIIYAHYHLYISLEAYKSFPWTKPELLSSQDLAQLDYVNKLVFNPKDDL